MNSVKKEIKNFIDFFRELDRNTAIVFFVIAILQTISYYFGSRYFFRLNVKDYLDLKIYEELYEYAYWMLSEFLIYFIIPIIIIKLIHKGKLKEYGISFGDYKLGFAATGIFAFIMTAVLWIVSSYPSIYNYYPMYKNSILSWERFFIFESLMLFYMIGWEYMWRGYALFGLKKSLGNYAVFVQMLPFVILHNGKPFLETFSSIFGGIIIGYFALRVGSFIYCAILHFYVIFTIDFICVLRHKTQIYDYSIESLINLISKISG